MDRLAPRLEPQRQKMALSGSVDPPRGAIYLKTPFRAEIGHGGWTNDGQLRQGRFIGPCDDLPIEPPRAAVVRPKGQGALVTHPERVLFPGEAITKGDVASYYDAVASRLALHLDHRPVSILRAPDGIGAETFFQRHPLKGMTLGVVEVSFGGRPYMALEGRTGLLTAAQFGAIELHGWMSRLDALDRPDRVIFDLDPHESVAFNAVKRAARDIADALEIVGLKSWPLLSGGKGVHVVAPLDRTLDVATVEGFAKAFSQGLASDAPGRLVATMSKARREGRIFIDWMRNKKGATAILPWSVRARPGAPVAVPVTWRNLAAIKSANAFSIGTAATRSDGWTGFFEARQTIAPKALAFLASR